jgi:hypothetical protein
VFPRKVVFPVLVLTTFYRRLLWLSGVLLRKRLSLPDKAAFWPIVPGTGSGHGSWHYLRSAEPTNLRDAHAFDNAMLINRLKLILL